jgi:hypothetical protein
MNDNPNIAVDTISASGWKMHGSRKFMTTMAIAIPSL